MTMTMTMTEQEQKYVETEVERLSQRHMGREVTDPKTRENLKRCYRDAMYRVTAVRTPYAAQKLASYEGQICRMSGNAYHGFEIHFADGRTVSSVHFYFKKV